MEYATEAVIALIEWAFQSNLVNKVMEECMTNNMASIRVLEKTHMIQMSEKDGMLYWEVNDAPQI